MAWHPGVLRSHLGERRMAPGPAGAKVHGNIVALSRATLVRGKIFGPPVPSEAYFSRCFHRADLPGPAVMWKPVFIGGGEASSQCALNPLRSTDLSTASASASKSAAHCRSCSRDSQRRWRPMSPCMITWSGGRSLAMIQRRAALARHTRRRPLPPSTGRFRRTSPVAVRPGEGPLIERTTGVRIDDAAVMPPDLRVDPAGGES